MSIKCDLSQEDRQRVFDGFDDLLYTEEEERIEALFHPHLFYTSVTRNRKACYCESCKTSFDVTRDSARALWIKGHGSPAECPRCKAKVELICDGRIRTGASLEESKCVMVVRTDPDGAVRLMAGVVKRCYERVDFFDDWNNVLHRELQPFLSFDQCKRYYLAPWGRMCWRHGYWNYFGERGPYGDWEPQSCIIKAFFPGLGTNWGGTFDGFCNVIGMERLAQSFAKYSGAAFWLAGNEDMPDTERVAYLEKYLALYIDIPQMEFAAKMGEEKVLSDLVIRGVKNHRIINWNAKNPAAFYRMDKQQYRRFKAAGGTTDDLLLAKELQSDVDTVIRAKSAVGSGSVRQLISCASKACISVDQAISYLGKQQGKTGMILPIWSDYLDMAEKLIYDLTDRAISTPKHLNAAHDRAAELLQVETDRTLNLKYQRKRLPALRKRFEMDFAGMCICVPKDTIEIGTEGMVLHHCVGGYAKRHIEGRTTILFLRDAEHPDLPLVTIEMEPDGKTIRQIHGYGNENIIVNGTYPPNPRTAYAEFLDVWLDWLAAGSPRTSTGTPIITTKQEAKSA